MTVTLPDDLAGEIDRHEKDPSKFVADAVRHELDRHRRAELRRSLENPHAASSDLADQGFQEWARGLPEEDTEALVDINAGTPVQWIPGKGWVETRE